MVLALGRQAVMPTPAELSILVAQVEGSSDAGILSTKGWSK